MCGQGAHPELSPSDRLPPRSLHDAGTINAFVGSLCSSSPFFLLPLLLLPAVSPFIWSILSLRVPAGLPLVVLCYIVERLPPNPTTSNCFFIVCARQVGWLTNYLALNMIFRPIDVSERDAGEYALFFSIFFCVYCSRQNISTMMLCGVGAILDLCNSEYL